MSQALIRNMFTVLLLFISIGITAETPQPLQPKGVATLDGGFWQVGPGLISTFSDEQLAEEVGHFRALDMDLIIIQYTAAQYDHEAKTYHAYVPNDILPYHPAFEGRDPIGAIMNAAEQHGVRVILGGLLMPLPRHINYESNLEIWTSEETMEYRRQVIERYRNNKAFYGFYTPNEPNPADLYASDSDPQKMIDATAQVIDVVRAAKPDLVIVKCIGLYLEPTETRLTHASRSYLDAFWRPWVKQLTGVDAWMVIDGVGTRLSNLEHTDMAQQWAKELAHEYGKEYWTDVENARMGAQNVPMTMDQLRQSLEVAARHASKLVTFDYAHYMSKLSHREAARQLYQDYSEYLEEIRAQMR